MGHSAHSPESAISPKPHGVRSSNYQGVLIVLMATSLWKYMLSLYAGQSVQVVKIDILPIFEVLYLQNPMGLGAQTATE